MKLKNETLNNSNRYLTGDELDILLGNVHDPCKYQYFLAFWDHTILTMEEKERSENPSKSRDHIIQWSPESWVGWKPFSTKKIFFQPKSDSDAVLSPQTWFDSCAMPNALLEHFFRTFLEINIIEYINRFIFF